MKLKLIALILGVAFGGYVVVQHGPPGLREKVLGLVSLVYDTFPGKAEERLPDEPAERSQALIKKLDTNLYELGNLAKIVGEKAKKQSGSTSSPTNKVATSTSSQNTSLEVTKSPEEKPKSFLENLFTPTDPKPEEKLQKVIESTQKIVSDLEQTNKKLQEEINQLKNNASGGGGGQVSLNQTSPSPPATGASLKNQSTCICEQK